MPSSECPAPAGSASTRLRERSDALVKQRGVPKGGAAKASGLGKPWEDHVKIWETYGKIWETMADVLRVYPRQHTSDW